MPEDFSESKEEVKEAQPKPEKIRGARYFPTERHSALSKAIAHIQTLTSLVDRTETDELDTVIAKNALASLIAKLPRFYKQLNLSESEVLLSDLLDLLDKLCDSGLELFREQRYSSRIEQNYKYFLTILHEIKRDSLRFLTQEMEKSMSVVFFPSSNSSSAATDTAGKVDDKKIEEAKDIKVSSKSALIRNALSAKTAKPEPEPIQTSKARSNCTTLKKRFC